MTSFIRTHTRTNTSTHRAKERQMMTCYDRFKRLNTPFLGRGDKIVRKAEAEEKRRVK